MRGGTRAVILGQRRRDNCVLTFRMQRANGEPNLNIVVLYQRKAEPDGCRSTRTSNGAMSSPNVGSNDLETQEACGGELWAWKFP